MRSDPHPRATMTTTTSRFSESDLGALDRAKILGVRAGTTHEHTGVWVVVVDGRVFVRSWNDKPTGWYRALRAEPRGTIAWGGKKGQEEREVAIRARPVRGARLLAAVTAAYAAKYDTPASLVWVRGFAEPAREATTLELVPAPRDEPRDEPRGPSARARAGSSTAKRRRSRAASGARPRR